MVNNSASVDIMLTVWWMVFLALLECEWTCDIDVAILFLMFTIEIMSMKLGSNMEFWKISSSLQRWALQLSLWFAWWKEKWLGKLSISLKPEEDSQLRESKKEKIPLKQLLY